MARPRPRPQPTRRSRFAPLWIALALGGVLLLFLAIRSAGSEADPAAPATPGAAIEIPHIHGIGFSGDGQTVDALSLGTDETGAVVARFTAHRNVKRRSER